MSIRIRLFSALLLICSASWGQKITYKGSVLDKDSKLPVEKAVVMLLDSKDSVLTAYCRTDKAGDFSFTNLLPGSYVALVSHPLFAEFLDAIIIRDAGAKGTPILLTSKSKMLETIIVKSGGAIKIKGDTTIYTADSFNVSANANVEELLKKLPGIQVDKNGDIKAMGEKVQKVLVDGEEFFGDDPGMAVKNIRADAVKEVQVFDKKSEQAAFTGIDDGKTQKTINLKLKEDKKKGYFGKVSTAGGLSEQVTNRFNNNIMFGSFKGKRKIAAFLLNGNTGQDGLSWQDQNKYGSSEDMNFEMYDEDGIFGFSMNATPADEEANINTQNGFIRNINAGLQYSNKWNDKHSINFSPKYNLQDYSNIRTNKTITQLGDSILDENSQTVNNTYRYNIKSSLIYDLKIDTSNSVKVTVKANYYNTDSRETTTSATSGLTKAPKNSVDRSTELKSEKQALTTNVIFKHKFKKARRTLSWSTDFNTINSNSTNKLYSANTFFYQTNNVQLVQDQVTEGDKSSSKISSKLTYTEPITKKWSLETAYELAVNSGLNNQITLTKAAGSSQYDEPIDSLTNNFKQLIIVHTPSAKFNYAFKKMKFNIGSGVGITLFDLLNKTTSVDYKRNYINLFPTASFVYNYKSNHTFRIRYNGYNSQPSIYQLQPVINNNSFFSKYTGNPDLKPSFASNLNFTNNGYVFLKNMWTYQSLNITYTQNAITNNRRIDPVSGYTETTPVNTSGNWNMIFWGGTGFKHKKTDINFQINLNTSYSRFADVINDRVSFANTVSGGLGFSMNKSKANKYDISLNNNCNVNFNKNAQSVSTNRFFINTLELDGTIYYKKVWSLTTNYEFYARGRVNPQTGPINNHLVNIQIQRTFRNNTFTTFVKVRDVLNQNISIDRFFNGNVFSEEENQRLRRYFILGFSWDFKNGSKKKTSK